VFTLHAQRDTRQPIDVCTTEQGISVATLYDVSDRKEITVLSALIVVLVLLWLLGIATSYTLGGLIHILLVIAVVVVLVRVIQGRNPLRG